MTEERCIVDHIDNTTVVADNHINSLNVLRSYLIGMLNLAEFTRKQEITTITEHPDLACFADFDDKELFLGCLFDWFAISLTNYLRLVRFMTLSENHGWTQVDLTDARIQDTIRKECRAYIESVAPSVYQWRNKIAAHRAATDPLDADNLTTLVYSTMPTISWVRPYYTAAGLRFGMSNGGNLGLEAWALTETFESLAPRFWPEARLSPLP